MFHSIPKPILSRMHHLESIDAQDRQDGTPQARRLRQIPPETGRFLALMAAAAPQGKVVEVGTSAGYSTLWLALACRQTGRKIVTYEFSPSKAELARETFLQRALSDERVDALVVPIGKGELVCRKL
ncbi:MAG: hypothetical protein PHS96_01040 [Anaerolineales bacterium]|nr:hypothetical protein [Anaerolineales bacterium]